LLLEIPINLTERTIIAQVRKMICQHPEREVARVSTAQRKLANLIGIRQDVIESAYAVWRAHYESRDGRLTEKIGQTTGSKSLYQIGKELRLVKTCMPAVTDDAKRAAMRVNGMKVAVSRMLLRANNLIENAAVGVFPSVQAQSTPILWRSVQQQRLAEAVAAKLWRPLFDADDVLTVP
jgi:isopentenyldiphosphate isomerase